MNLPAAVCLEIKRFLLEREYFNWLKSSKGLYHPLFSETRILYLKSPSDCLCFAEDVHFRRDILSKLNDSSKQLYIVFQELSSFSDSNLENIFSTPLYGLDLNHGKRVFSFFTKVAHSLQEFSVFDCPVPKELPDFPKAVHVALRCDTLLKLPSFPFLQTIVINDAPLLQDVSCFANINNLRLHNLPKVSDVNCLGRVRHLTLDALPSITDISGLSQNYSLTIHHCQNIEDNLPLSNARCLQTDLIQECDDTAVISSNTISVELMGYQEPIFYLCSESIRKLTLVESSLLQIIGVCTSFKNLREIVFYRCLNLERADSFLSTVPFLTFRQCLHLQDISALGNNGHDKRNKSVEIFLGKSLHDFSALRNVPKVHLQSCVQFANAEELQGVSHLILDNCQRLNSFEGFEDIPIFEFYNSNIQSNPNYSHGLRPDFAKVLKNNQKVVTNVEKCLKDLEEIYGPPDLLIERQLHETQQKKKWVFLKKKNS
jgi:hypothetical protein